MDERLAEIRAIWKQNQWLYVAAGFLLGVLFQPFLQYLRSDTGGFLQNLVPEAIGILVTVFIIERIYRWHEKTTWKKTLIYDMGSRIREVAVHAAEILEKEKWLYENSLQGKNFMNADLRGAKLIQADLRRTHLVRVNLESADLTSADLRASLLHGANLKYTTLETWAGGKTKFSSETLLPNDSYWTPETDMRRFTDPTHPEFWRSDDPSSPAYRGKQAE
jgi:hypothetical protein